MDPYYEYILGHREPSGLCSGCDVGVAKLRGCVSVTAASLIGRARHRATQAGCESAILDLEVYSKYHPELEIIRELDSRVLPG